MDKKVFQNKIARMKIKSGDYVLVNTRYHDENKEIVNDEFAMKFLEVIEQQGKLYIQATALGITANQNIEEIVRLRKLVIVE